MKYGSVCSGIEAASLAWKDLGWKCSFLSEIDEFPRAVLSHHYPDSPLHGDFTTIQAGDYEPIDLLIGGTPCQSFSIAGLRKGLEDERGNLALEYLRLVDRLQPTWVVWENVTGVLSSNGGRDFGAFLGALEELGYKWAYRTLDAQYFGVPQRRRRVFVVGHIGDPRRPGEVLFDPESVSGHSPPSSQSQQRSTAFIATGAEGGSGAGVMSTLDTQCGLQKMTHQNVKNGHIILERYTTGTITARMLPALGARDVEEGAIHPEAYGENYLVRKLTPVECERLQGFPDNYTAVPYKGKKPEKCPVTPRYTAIGNSMAVPVMKWLGERINRVHAK